MEVWPASDRDSVYAPELFGFREAKLRVQNYFEYYRSGQMLDLLAQGQAPWENLDPQSLIVPGAGGLWRLGGPGGWNDIYGQRRMEDVLERQRRNRKRFGGGKSGSIGRDPRTS